MVQYPASRLPVEPGAHWAEWRAATNGQVKGYFLSRCIDGPGCTGQIYSKPDGKIITFQSREAAEQKAAYFNKLARG